MELGRSCLRSSTLAFSQNIRSLFSTATTVQPQPRDNSTSSNSPFHQGHPLLKMSACDTILASHLLPTFTPPPHAPESPNTQSLIPSLFIHSHPHPEGGYFVETDRDPLCIPNPFQADAVRKQHHPHPSMATIPSATASTTIYYLLTPANPKGGFQRNKGRTTHTLHSGRGRYVIIHADEVGNEGKARIETFVVGHDIHAGERMQWMVEGGKYQASFLLPDREGGSESRGLLISEVR